MKNKNIPVKVIEMLLKIKAITLHFDKPKKWSKGWHTPIYVDNRKSITEPDDRNILKKAFIKRLCKLYPDIKTNPEKYVIAGVATGAVPIAVIVAEELDVSYLYVRSSAKKHGNENQVEGNLVAVTGKKVIVLEDLVSTGGSSLEAVEALRAANLEVIGMVAIFTYGFPLAEKNFEEAGVKLNTLADYKTLIENYEGLSEEKRTDLLEWYKDANKWSVEHGGADLSEK